MFSEIRPKICTYGCGVEIYWNNEENSYHELHSRKKHICPNLLQYNNDSKILLPTTAAKPSYINNELSNTSDESTKIRIISNMDNSFEFLEGISNKIKKHYEFLSDIIIDGNGKIHASHSHLYNNSICLVIQYEDPKVKEMK